MKTLEGTLKTTIIASDDQKHVYEICREFDCEGEEVILLTLYPTLVEPKLRISVNHGSPQYYRVSEEGERGGTYLSKKKEMNTIKDLAQKEYTFKLVQCMENNLKAIERAKKAYEKMERLNIYPELSEERKALVVPNVLDGGFEKEWQNVTYQGKKFQDNDLEIYTEKGERVRSKSEKMIADKMYLMGIPYRYECPLRLDSGIYIYPDFTILNVPKRKEYLLEHFGMMDNPEYSQKAVKKINAYIKNGIYPGEKLLLTYETSQSPIDMTAVSLILEKYCK